MLEAKRVRRAEQFRDIHSHRYGEVPQRFDWQVHTFERDQHKFFLLTEPFIGFPVAGELLRFERDDLSAIAREVFDTMFGDVLAKIDCDSIDHDLQPLHVLRHLRHSVVGFEIFRDLLIFSLSLSRSN